MLGLIQRILPSSVMLEEKVLSTGGSGAPVIVKCPLAVLTRVKTAQAEILIKHLYNIVFYM